MIISTSKIKRELKRTVRKIISDKPYTKANLVLKEIFNVKRQEDNWVDDQEIAGPGLAAEKLEGASMTIGTITEGSTYRFLARTYGIRIVVTREAVEDNKYGQAISANKRAMRSLMKTADIDATLVLARGGNSAFTFGDGQSLWSASHPLAQGGTLNNTLTVPLAPSVAAVASARSLAGVMVGNDGLTEGYMLKKVVHPHAQISDWEVVLNSQLDTDSHDNTSQLNIAKRLRLQQVPNPYWDQFSTTNSCFITDAEEGLCFNWRRNESIDTYDGNEQHIMSTQVHARWSRGTNGPRGVIGNQA